MSHHRIVVLGGAGAMGRITVRDLVETSPDGTTVVIADYDLAKAKAYEENLKALPASKRVQVESAHADASKPEALRMLLKGAFCVINAAPYQMNVQVMEAAADSGSHYVDLGGLFHVTLEQLKLHDRFQSAQRLAILGMGAAPGITNLLAHLAALKLEEVHEVHCRVAGSDQSKYVPKPALGVSYSLATILDEFSKKPAVFTKGKMTFQEPMSGAIPLRFPPPIGVAKPMYTIHSEVATLSTSYPHVKEASFKIAFDEEFLDRVKFIRDLGLGSREPIEVSGVRVKPIDVVNFVAMNQPPSKVVGPLKQFEVVRSIVKGKAKGKKITYIMDCHTKGMPDWGIGLDIDTGSPPAVAAQMLMVREITLTGALPPEKCVDPELFFKRLKIRKMKVVQSKKSGWDLKC